jgi:hypothetical protein
MSYGNKPGSLINGAPLVVEDLDLSRIGCYTQDQKDVLLKSGVLEDDFFLGSGWFSGYWMRKSDEGQKWHVFEDKYLKLHKSLVKKDKK